jgi:cytochrome c551/c552
MPRRTPAAVAVLVLCGVALVASGCFEQKSTGVTIRGAVTVGTGTTATVVNPAQGAATGTTSTSTGTTSTSTTTTSTSTGTTSTGGTSGGNTALAVSTFSSAGCTSCHTWAPAKATGKIGPDLDNISADYKAWSAKNKGKSVADFVHESIVKPDAYIAKGFSKGIMPGTFGSSLKPDQLNALVQAISSTTKSS